MSESKDPPESNEPNESPDPFAPGTPPPGWTPSGPGQSWEYQQPAQPQWGQPPSEPIGPPQEQIPPHWQQPYGQPPAAPGGPPPGQAPYGQPPAGPGGPPPGQAPYGQPPPYGQAPQYGQPQYGQPQYGQPQYPQPPLPGIPPGVEIGGLGKRLLARILDSLVLLPVWIVVAIATWDSGLGGQLLGTLVQTAAFFAYDTYFISKRGQTIGKGWMGLRVVLLENGQIPDQNAAAKRAGLYNFSWIACYIGSIVVALSPLFDATKRKQGFHDKLGKTVVIKA